MIQRQDEKIKWYKDSSALCSDPCGKNKMIQRF